MKLIKLISLAAIPALLMGCGSDTSSSTTQSKVSFFVSDAPVDNAEEVVVAFDKLEFIAEDGETYLINVDESDVGNDFQQLDLLDYPGSDAALILTDQVLPIGKYKNLIIHVKPDNDLNYVVDDKGQHDLKQPSNKLKLGGFEILDAEVQSFTIEFDLRKSLVMRGNSDSNNGYILKPHGVTIVDNGNAASLKGTVDFPLLGIADECNSDTGNYVYLYEQHGLDSTLLADNMVPIDENFNHSIDVPEGVFVPYASTDVALDTESGEYTYVFGFIPAGDYTVAFSCSAENDDPIQYDGIIIANPEDQVAEVVLRAPQEEIYHFKEK